MSEHPTKHPLFYALQVVAPVLLLMGAIALFDYLLIASSIHH